jgi:hypothetical protein
MSSTTVDYKDLTLGDSTGILDKTGYELKVGDVVLYGSGYRYSGLRFGVVSYGHVVPKTNWQGKPYQGGFICIAAPGQKGNRRRLDWDERAVYIPDTRVPKETMDRVEETRKSLKTWRFL